MIKDITILKDQSEELFNLMLRLDDNSRQSQQDLNLMSVALASLTVLCHNMGTRPTNTSLVKKAKGW